MRIVISHPSGGLMKTDLDALDVLFQRATHGKWNSYMHGMTMVSEVWTEDRKSCIARGLDEYDANLIWVLHNRYEAMAAELRAAREVVEFFGKFFPFSPLVKKYDEATRK